MEINAQFPPTLSAFMQDNSRHRFVLGPFGSGKSYANIIEVVRRASMQAPGPDGLRKSRFAVVRNTQPQLRDTTMKSWFDVVPNGSIGHYRETGKTFFIETGDIRSEILFRGLDDSSDVKNLLSMELSGVWLNEFKDIAREILDALDGRIGRYPRMADGGPSWTGIFGDSNYPSEGSFWERSLEGYDPDKPREKKPNGWKVFKQPPAMLQRIDGAYELNPLAENISNLPKNYYQHLVDGKGRDYIRTFVMCEYGHSLAGKPVHPSFSRAVHVAKSPLIADPNNLMVLTADFGLTPSVIGLQQNAFGQVLVLFEIVEFGMGIERLIEEKLLPLLRRKYDDFECMVTGDPSGAQSSQADETSCVQIFQRYKRKGLGRVKLAYSNSPVFRQGALDYFLNRMVDAGRPALLVDPQCEWIIQALSGKYAFKKFKDGRESSDVEKSDWSHCAEALEYGCMFFERGGRRKRETEERKSVEQVEEPPNAYAMPR